MSKFDEYAPYYRNGLLFLPAKTIVLLTDAGLDRSVGEAALSGLSLDDDREMIAMISKSLENALAQVEEDTQEFIVLTSPETQFMLTGKPVAV